ncbi:aldehyde dehydrogenase family protein [Rubrobacter taiwanensis]|uniref:Aldehyde dehydrogenase family protein n=1 Tax=Rubrobacter taiwanensis TaxID=185139 RepID=A0A4R1BQI3_9ACTN|nr:aldehyde dehydrogenase family protein [Rubrobacter taiwanensis]TCJ19964.1 aldehyde dehydrogenase family protein [Rubrobacter taiwanensis]
MPEIRDRLFIGGEWTSSRSGQTFGVVDPSTEEVIATVARGTAGDVGDAVGAAREAFNGPWRRLTPEDRSRLLYRVARVLESRLDEFAELETLDTGKPLQHSRSEISGCVRYFDYYAGAADKIHGETIPLGPDYLNYTVREPLGVTAHIVPWNAPLSMVCRSLAPALAAGNTAVVKPAEQTPLTALKFAEVFLELDFPPGIYNVVAGFGEDAGKALSEHPGIDSITFTGSVETGRAVLKAAAEHVKPVVLELGGKSPQIVFADCDLELAANEVAKGLFSNAGQYCDAGSRLLVEDSIRETFLKKVIENARAIKLGAGIDDPDMGPLVSAEHFERVLNYIDTGQKEGAHMLIGGCAEGFEKGYFVAPTIFDKVERGMRIAQEEIFGPVLVTLSFNGEDEAIDIANDSSYGLAAGIFTRNIDRALRFASEIQAGYVMINEYFSGGIGSPFGGYKLSGYGRERGLVALENYTQIKNTVVKISVRACCL